MAIKFGGVKSGVKLKEVSTDELNIVIADTVTENPDNPYYIFLLDNVPDILSKNTLLKEINKVCKEYLVLLCTDIIWHESDLKGNGIANFFVKHRSKWRKYVNYKGRHNSGIMCFGQAMYSINECADIQTTDFIADDFVWSYYYMGHQLWNCDSYIYPVFGVKQLWPKVDQSLSSTNWKTRFTLAQMKKMVNPRSRVYKPMLDEPVIHKVTSKEEADKLFFDNMNQFLVAWDTETSGLTFYKDSHKKYKNIADILSPCVKDHIHCLTVCWDGIHGYYIPIEYVDLDLMVENFMSCQHNTGANPKFDIKMFWEMGAPHKLMVTDATDIAAHAIHSDRPKGLKPQSFYFTQFGGYELALDKWKKETGCDNYSKIPDEVQVPYATMDAISTWQAQVKLWELMDYDDKLHPNEKMPDWTIRRWYEQQMMTIYTDACETEFHGIYVNWDLMNKNRTWMQNDCAEKHQKLRELWGLPNNFNITSTVELGKAFEKLGFPEHGRNKQGIYSTDGDAIAAWKREGMPGVDLLDEVRTELTTCNSFLGYIASDGNPRGWLSYIKNHMDEDGSVRIHHNYNVMGTTSFRFIGNNPNFQNVPTNGKYAPLVKRCVDTPPSDLFILTSESGKEYRLPAFELVYVLRENNERTYVRASEVKESDTIIENDEMPTIISYEITKQEDGHYVLPRDILFCTNDKEAIKEVVESELGSKVAS